MKRSTKQVIREASMLIWKDIKDYKGVWLSIGIYFLIIWKVFYTSCSMVLVTGYPCPACGMTRAGFALLRGDFLLAWHMHPFVYAVAILAVVAIIKRYFLKQDLKKLRKWCVFLVLGACVFYVYRMWRYFPGDAPISYYNNNLLHRIFDLYLGK